MANRQQLRRRSPRRNWWPARNLRHRRNCGSSQYSRWTRRRIFLDRSQRHALALRRLRTRFSRRTRSPERPLELHATVKRPSLQHQATQPQPPETPSPRNRHPACTARASVPECITQPTLQISAATAQNANPRTHIARFLSLTYWFGYCCLICVAHAASCVCVRGAAPPLTAVVSHTSISVGSYVDMAYGITVFQSTVGPSV